MSNKTLKRICMGVFFAGLANFTAFWIAAVILGGDAEGGRIQDGRYYLSIHGRLTEVSRGTYFYSRAHTHSVWITHPLAILAALAASRIGKHEKRIRAETA